MTFLEHDVGCGHFDYATESGIGVAIADPERIPETAGQCSVAGCGCSAFVRDYYGNCAG
jgi:hypothetical protein